MMQTKKQVQSVIPLRMEEFSKHADVLQGGVHVFDGMSSSDQWFKDFKKRLLGAIEAKEFLPVFRMSHGEFHFALGTRINPELSLFKKLYTLKTIAKERLGIGAYLNEFSPQAGTREVLSKAEFLKIKDRVIADLRWISEVGLLCACFHRSPGYIEYLPDIFDWMDRNRICLNRENYFHFYFIYALLFGSSQVELFEGRNVLVITSFPGDKRECVIEGIKKVGARSVETLEISSSRALFDRISLDELNERPDFVLIGAGVGSTNIIRQLGELNCPVLDVGFGIDALADPDVRWRRPFCITDREWDMSRIGFRPKFNVSKYVVNHPFRVNW